MDITGCGRPPSRLVSMNTYSSWTHGSASDELWDAWDELPEVGLDGDN